jgi:hypothetical protein
MTPEEVAKTILQFHRDGTDRPEDLETRIVNAQNDARSQALEEAARVAETIQFTPEQESDEADCHCALIAAAIRALKSP